ncbi:MAG: putative cupin superfamily protein [Paracoccaceae bacterium]|jgi:uncharacterized cupin superfamily protein
MVGRSQQPLGDAAGIAQFGANMVTLIPAALSSSRHRHEHQDEFLVVAAGVCTLIDDHGETELRPGDCAGFAAGDASGPHLVNKGVEGAKFVVVGTHTPAKVGHHSDVDMKVVVQNRRVAFMRRNGGPIEEIEG